MGICPGAGWPNSYHITCKYSPSQPPWLSPNLQCVHLVRWSQWSWVTVADYLPYPSSFFSLRLRRARVGKTPYRVVPEPQLMVLCFLCIQNNVPHMQASLVRLIISVPNIEIKNIAQGRSNTAHDPNFI